MSNFAPFVAATLRDKVVHELQQENLSLREENNRLRAEGATCTIFITGPGGSPVYAKAALSHRFITEQLIAGGIRNVTTTNRNVAFVQVSMAMEQWRGWRQPRDDSTEQRSALRKFRAQSILQAAHATNPLLWQPPSTLTE